MPYLEVQSITPEEPADMRETSLFIDGKRNDSWQRQVKL